MYSRHKQMTLLVTKKSGTKPLENQLLCCPFSFFWREGRSLKIGFVKRVIFYAVYNNIWCWCEKWFGSLMLNCELKQIKIQWNTIEWKILFLSQTIYFSKVWSKRNALTSSIYRNGFTQVAHHAFWRKNVLPFPAVS